MNSDNFINLFTPSCLIIAGIYMRVSNDKSKFGNAKKYSLFFIIGGGILLLYRLWKLSK